MRLKRLYTILFLSIIFQNYIIGQHLTQTIRGKIIDKDTKLALPGANVIVINTNPLKGNVSDLNGHFKIEQVSIGRQSLRISFLGYEDLYVREIEITSAKETYLNIELKQSYVQSEEVVITSKFIKQGTSNDMTLVSSRSFSVDETNRYAASWGDPSRMAANFAGVSIVSDKRNDIIVRGNSPMNVLWKLDGIEIPNPNHFAVAGSSGGAISMINNNLLDNSDFHTGAFPAEYANALSAVFDLKLRNGNNEKREYIFQAGVNGFEGGIEGPFIKGNKSSYLINYRYSTLTLLDKAGISIIEAVPNFQDISYKFNFPIKKGFISFFGIGGLSMADYKPDKNLLFLNDSRNRWGYVSGTKMGVAALSFQQLITNKTYLKMTLSTSAYYPFDSNDSTGLDFNVYKKYQNEFVENKNGLNILLNSKLSRKSILRGGASFQQVYIKNNSYIIDYLPSEQKQILSNINGDLSMLQMHLQWLYQIRKNISITSGLNSTHLFLNNKSTIEPRLGFKWEFSESNAITAGFGVHSQAQPYAIYFIERTDNNGLVTLPNKALDFSQSIHYVLGYEKQLSESIRLKFETYCQFLSKIPVKENNPYFSLLNFATDDNIFGYSNLDSKGIGRNYGIEGTFEKFLTKGFYFLFTATIFESQYKDGLNNWRNTRFNSRYLFTALAGKDIKFKNQKNSIFGIHAKFSYVGGQRFTPIDTEMSKLFGRGIYVDSLSFSSQYPSFYKFDIRLRYKLNKKFFSCEFALDITNVLNRKNIEYQKYDAYLQDIRYVYNLSRIPVVFIKFEF